jgi:hypothetical protein
MTYTIRTIGVRAKVGQSDGRCPMIPVFYSDSLPLLGKIVLAGIVLVGLFLFVRAYIRNGRL